MPQEFLRDVLRTGDAPNRARRRLSVLPISIAAHAVAVTAFMMSPFITAVEMPAIAAPRPDWMPIASPTPPSPPPPPRTTAPDVAPAAPTAAPDHIEPEPVESPRPASTQPGVPGGVDIGVETGGGSVLAATNVERPAPPPVPVAPSGPVRIGGHIREPRRLVQVQPIYPEFARNSRVQGSVILEALLDVTGKVERVTVLKSAPLLDDAAVNAVKQWRYTPTQLNGVPVPVLMTITVVFSLER